MRGHRILTLALAGIISVGSLAACSSSKKSDNSKSGSGSGSSASSNTSSSNPKVQAYCKAVDKVVGEVLAAKNDPSKAAALASESQDLAQKAAAATTGASPADAKAIAACTTKSTNALKQLTPGG